MGRASDSWRTPEAWDRCWPIQRGEVHGRRHSRHRRPGRRSSRITSRRSAADFFVVPSATYRLLFVLVILAHERRRIVHVAVTEHPTAAWTTQQVREAFPWDDAPRYLIHNCDHAFAGIARSNGFTGVVDGARSPWQNAYVERLMGSVRRQCLDHVVVLNAAGLRRVIDRLHRLLLASRTDLSLDKDSPVARAVASPTKGDIVAIPKSAVCIIATNGSLRNTRAAHGVARTQCPLTDAEHNRPTRHRRQLAYDAFAMKRRWPSDSSCERRCRVSSSTIGWMATDLMPADEIYDRDSLVRLTIG